MRARWLLVLGFMIAGVAPSPAFAGPLPAAAKPLLALAPDDPQVVARTKGEEGLRLFEAGKWASAYEAFHRADELFHAPTLVLYMAHCRRNQGKLVEARALYDKVVAEPVPKGAPEQFLKAVASAQEELGRIRKRIASVRVRLTSPAPASTTLKIDDAVISPDQWASAKDLDPGEHEIVAEADGIPAVRQTVTLKEGEATEVTLTLQEPDKSRPPPPPPPPPRRGSVMPGAIALGVGGVGIGLGAVTGIVAFSNISDIKSRCRPDNHCLKADQPKADTAQTLTTVSTVGFVVGGAAAVAGAILLVVRPGGAKVQSKTALRVEIGPSSLSLRGRF